MKRLIAAAAAVLCVQGVLPAEPFSIAAVAGPRRDQFTFGNVMWEIQAHEGIGKAAPAACVVVAGDMDPFAATLGTFNTMFPVEHGVRPQFLPVVGEYDIRDSIDYSGLISSIDDITGVSKRDNNANYFLDHRNVRIIVVNAYDHAGNQTGFSGGCVGEVGRAWVDSTIAAAVHAEHVFVALHEPPFPRNAAIGESFDACPDERNAFWTMLLSHGSKVKAVLVSHTNVYSRLRVKDPLGAAANDPHLFPDEEGGIYQVDVGATGQGERATVVNIEIDGSLVNFRVSDAFEGSGNPFELIDAWSIGTTTVARRSFRDGEAAAVHPGGRTAHRIGPTLLNGRRPSPSGAQRNKPLIFDGEGAKADLFRQGS